MAPPTHRGRLHGTVEPEVERWEELCRALSGVCEFERAARDRSDLRKLRRDAEIALAKREFRLHLLRQAEREYENEIFSNQSRYGRPIQERVIILLEIWDLSKQGKSPKIDEVDDLKRLLSDFLEWDTEKRIADPLRQVQELIGYRGARGKGVGGLGDLVTLLDDYYPVAKFYLAKLGLRIVDNRHEVVRLWWKQRK